MNKISGIIFMLFLVFVMFTVSGCNETNLCDETEYEDNTEKVDENLNKREKEWSNVDSSLYVNVKDFGAEGNGVNDDSQAIQEAIDSIAKTGGTVFIPAGVYRMANGVKVPVGVSIEGTTYATTGPWQQFLDAQDKNQKAITHYHMGDAGDNYLQFDMYKGTWILVDHGVGDINSAPTFQLYGSTSIKKLGFVHKNLPPVTRNVVEHPPAIALYSDDTIPYTRDGVTIEDISLANPYVGIVIATGTDLENYYIGTNANDIGKSCGRHRVHNIMGGPIYKGLWFKGLLDTVDINNIQFNFSNYENGYVMYRADNCTDLEFARGDGMNISNVLSFGAKYGLRTLPGYGKRDVSLRASNINLEAQIPLSLKASGQYEITNSYFLTIEGGDRHLEPEDKFVCIEIETDSECIHQSHILLNNLFLQKAFMSEDLNSRILDVKLDSNSNVVLNNSMFWGWESSQNGESVISFKHKNAGPAGLQINNSIFTNVNLKGKLIDVDGIGLKSGDVVFSNCRIPDTLQAKEIRNKGVVWFKSCYLSKNNGENKILDTDLR